MTKEYNTTPPSASSIGLVLEGGGLRAMFTSGVLDVFMENGIKFDAAVGVSAGVLFGCNYKSNQPGRALRYNIRYKDNRGAFLQTHVAAWRWRQDDKRT